MRDRQSEGALNDDPLAREIAQALDVEPSPEFLASVRARLLDEPEPRGWRLWWALGPAVAAVAMMTVAVLWRTPDTAGPTTESASTRLAIEQSVLPLPDAGPAQPSRAETAPATPPRPLPARRDAGVTRTMPLVPEDEARAFDALLSTIRDREVELVFDGDSRGALAASSLLIPPITIEPVPPPAALEGGVE